MLKCEQAICKQMSHKFNISTLISSCAQCTLLRQGSVIRRFHFHRVYYIFRFRIWCPPFFLFWGWGGGEGGRSLPFVRPSLPMLLGTLQIELYYQQFNNTVIIVGISLEEAPKTILFRDLHSHQVSRLTQNLQISVCSHFLTKHL